MQVVLAPKNIDVPAGDFIRHGIVKKRLQDSRLLDRIINLRSTCCRISLSSTNWRRSGNSLLRNRLFCLMLPKICPGIWLRYDSDDGSFYFCLNGPAFVHTQIVLAPFLVLDNASKLATLTPVIILATCFLHDMI